MKAAFAYDGSNNCIQSGAIATTRQYADLHCLFLRRCKMDFPQTRETPEDTSGTLNMLRKH
jgi:hypothetical protein